MTIPTLVSGMPIQGTMSANATTLTGAGSAPQIGDKAFIFVSGVYIAGTGSPVAPTYDNSSGSDAGYLGGNTYGNLNGGAGRVRAYYKTLVSDDFSGGGVLRDLYVYAGGSFQQTAITLVVFHDDDGFFIESGTPPSVYYFLSSSAANTGNDVAISTTDVDHPDPTVPAIVIVAGAWYATVTSPLILWDGGASEAAELKCNNYSALAWKFYDSADVVTSYAWHNGQGNTTHVNVAIVVRGAQPASKLSGKSNSISKAKGTLVPRPTPYFSGKANSISKAKGLLKVGRGLVGKGSSIASAGAPNGMARAQVLHILTGKSQNISSAKGSLNAIIRKYFVGKSSAISKAEGLLRVGSSTLLEKAIILAPDQLALNYTNKIWLLIDGDNFDTFDSNPTFMALRMDSNFGNLINDVSGIMTRLGAGYYFDWRPTIEGLYLLKVIGQKNGAEVFVHTSCSTRLKHDPRALQIYGLYIQRF